MEELIEFTLLLKQVDDDELIQFLTASMKGYGHHLFRKLFFNYFMNHRTNIKEHTQCLSDIINARKDKPNLCTDFTSYDRIDKLPSTLIAECASYLPLNEYVRFSQSNRQIFVSVNKPFKLYELTALHQCPQTSMRKFKAVKSIYVDIENFNEHISIPNQSIWKDSSFDKMTLSNSWLNDTETAAFFNKKAINLSKTKKLVLCYFGNGTDNYNCEAFCEILRCLQNARCLSFEYIYLDRQIQSQLFNKDHIQKWFPNLSSFSMRRSGPRVADLSTAIINSIGHQLESLTIEYGRHSQPKLKCNFSKLRELELWNPTPQFLTVFSKVTALQSMSVTSDKKPVLQSCVDFMLKKQNSKSIHQMRISTRDTKLLKYVFDRIQSTLFDSYYQGVKRDALSISIRCTHCISRCISGNIDMVPVVEVFKLLNTLKSVHINDFMVQIHFSLSRTMEKQYVSAFDKMKDDYLVYSDTKADFIGSSVFAIYNKGCKINGIYSGKL